MNRIDVRIIAAPSLAEAVIGQLEALEGFTVAYVSGPRPSHKVPGAVRRYVTVTAGPAGKAAPGKEW